MPLNKSDWQSAALELFDDLGGYEKGALARALLKSLIRQGSLTRLPRGDCPGQITISVRRWQLDLLAQFSEDCELAKEENDSERLLKKLCQVR